MKRICKFAIFGLALPWLGACAPAFDAYADAMIAHEQAVDGFYDRIGYTAAQEKMRAAGVEPGGGGREFIIGDASPGANTMGVDPVRARMEYEQQRNQDLIMQHGAGGCTPNFSTGGCL